jgi:LacI family transcriptional regulator
MRAREQGFNIIICDTDEVLDRERASVNLLLSRQVDGIIIAPCSMHSEDYLVPLAQDKPFIFIDREPRQIDTDYVTPDKAAGAYEAVMHLVDQGLQRIAIVMNTIEGQVDYQEREWLGGYKQALRKCQLPINDDLIQVGRRGSFSESDGYGYAKALLQLDNPPQAILACTHFTTMGVLRAARELNRRIPDDLALVGYEDVLYMSYLNPSVTVVSQPWAIAGRWAVDRLIQRLDAEDSGQERPAVTHKILPVHLIVRESSMV